MESQSGKNQGNKAYYTKNDEKKGRIVEGLWERIFPAVSIKKDVEELKKQMDELLEMTRNALKEKPDKCDGDTDFYVGGEVEAEPVAYSNEIEVEIKEKEEPEKEIEGAGIGSQEEKSKDIVLELIRLRDQLLLSKFNSDEKSGKMFDSLYEELGRILKIHGVEPIEEAGVFNSLRHSVVQIIPTKDRALNDNIAKTLRPGYRIGQRVIRSQEVAIYGFEP